MTDPNILLKLQNKGMEAKYAPMTAESLVRTRIERAMADIRELANDFGFSDETIMFQKIDAVGEAFDNAADRYFEQPPLAPHDRAIEAHDMVCGGARIIEAANKLNVCRTTIRKWMDVVTEYNCWERRQEMARTA